MYSRVYGSAVLPVFERREPSWLEYLLVRQLRPEIQILRVDVAYEGLCWEVALYRLIPGLNRVLHPPTPLEHLS